MNSQTSNDGVETANTTPIESNTASPDVEMHDASDNLNGTTAEREAQAPDAIKEEDENVEQEGDDENDNDNDNDDEDDDDEDEEASLSLPLSKIKKIFKMDPDYIAASQSAVYATGLATELFIQYLVEQASSLAKRSKRKKIIYNDFSDAVKGHDSLIFLKDTVPEKQKLESLIEKNILDSNGHPTDRNPIASSSLGFEDESKKPGLVHSAPESAAGGAAKAKGGKNAAAAPKPLGKGQQTLNFANVVTVDPRPIKKAVIHDLIANDVDDEPAAKDVEMVE